jgi:hypothetical protein
MSANRHRKRKIVMATRGGRYLWRERLYLKSKICEDQLFFHHIAWKAQTRDAKTMERIAIKKKA